MSPPVQRPGEDHLGSALLKAWASFADSPVRPFTIPGHKRRAAAVSPTLGRLLESDVPLFGGLAPVKDAVADLDRAERCTADRWGADWCRYGTGGTTQANQSVALALARPGDTVLVSRNAHRSTFTGLLLAGLEPVWLPLEVDPAMGLPTGVSRATLLRALQEHPDAAALLLVEPTYVGTLSDRVALIETAHAHGLAVAVDQAWGAHLGFHPAYPEHALALGADVVTFSAHKTLPAYSQASVVLARTDRVSPARLQRGFDALNTTSPAGSILASIDAACALLASAVGAELLDGLHRRVGDARAHLRAAVDGLLLPSEVDVAPGRFDPAKLVLLLGRAGLDGVAVEQHLLEAGLPVEQADRDTVVPIVSMLDDDDTLGALTEALVAACRAEGPRGTEAAPGPRHHPATSGTATSRATGTGWALPEPTVAVSPRTAFFAEHERVPAPQAVGRVSGELIAPYPPGIPVVAPGEVVTEEVLETLLDARRRGVRIAYADDPGLDTFTVLR